MYMQIRTHTQKLKAGNYMTRLGWDNYMHFLHNNQLSVKGKTLSLYSSRDKRKVELSSYDLSQDYRIFILCISEGHKPQHSKQP